MQNNNWYAEAKWLTANELGEVLVVAPHQDDESLGCGGIIALLRESGLRVHVLFVTDGSKSHPNSKEFPTDKRVALREEESINALSILGVEYGNISFLRLQDGALPASGETGFNSSVKLMADILTEIYPQTIFMPWQRDPHRDHRATWEIINEAIIRHELKPRKLEYLIWLWERADPNDLPQAGEVMVWKTDIESVRQKKKKAIAAHVSQTTNLIHDDPEGFILSPEVLAHFDKNIEIFIEQY